MDVRPSDATFAGAHVDLAGIFEIATVPGDPDSKKLFLTRSTKRRLARLLNLTDPLDPDWEVAESIMLALTAICFHRKPIATRLLERLEANNATAAQTSIHRRLFGNDSVSHSQKPTRYTLSADDLKDLKRILTDFEEIAESALSLQRSIAPLIAGVFKAKPATRAAKSQRLQRIFEYVAKRMTLWRPENPKPNSWTCNYRESPNGTLRAAPIAVAALEVAFVLTQNRWALPTKAELFKEMERLVVDRKSISAPMRSKIIKQSGLQKLPEKRTW